MPPERVLGSPASWGHHSVENALFTAVCYRSMHVPTTEPHTHRHFPPNLHSPPSKDKKCTHPKGSLESTRVGFPGGSDCKESSHSAEEPGSIPGLEDPLEKGIATHSSILAWRIPRTEEPGRLLYPWGCKESDTTERLTLSLSLSSTGLLRLLWHSGADRPGQRARERRNGRTHKGT